MMGNMNITSNGVTVSRKSTWSVTSTGEGQAITEYTETVTEGGVTTQEKHTTTREGQPRPDLTGNFPPHYTTLTAREGQPRPDVPGNLPPHYTTPTAREGEPRPDVPGNLPPPSDRGNPKRTPSAPASESPLPTTSDACPGFGGVKEDLPSCSSGDQEKPPSAPVSESHEEAEMKMDEGEGFVMVPGLKDKNGRKETPENRPADNGELPVGEKGAPPPSPSDQEPPLSVEEKDKELPQVEKDPPPPYTPGHPPEYTRHEREAGPDPAEPVTMEVDPGENPDHAQKEQQQEGSDLGPSQSIMDPQSESPGFFGRLIGKGKKAAMMERDTVYKTKNIETARAMMKCDEESEKKMMDITQSILNDLAGK